MSNREEQIDQWILQDGINRQRRERIIPSSTDQITHSPLGTGLEAMEKVAEFFGDHPELPIVELGQIKQEEITLTFGVEADLPEPFQLRFDDDASQWAIAHEDALDLTTGEEYGHQMSGLTAVGNSLNADSRQMGSKLLLNTTSWQLLGSVGLAEFSKAIMVGQVMEQATEPWAWNHHIWLVGYGELGRMIVSYLSSYHPEDRFHLKKDLEEISEADLAGRSSTIYVMGSDDSTLDHYQRLRGSDMGMMTDSVITDHCMFISEDEDEAATIVNVGPSGMKIYPNLIGDNSRLFQGMEMVWEKQQQEAEEAHEQVQNLSVADFMDEADHQPVDETQADEELSFSDEDLQAWLTPEQATETAEGDNQTLGPDEQINDTPQPDSAQDEKATDPEPVEKMPEVEGNTSSETVFLLGTPVIKAGDAEASGKYAEAIAYLHLHEGSADPLEITEALWPEAEATGASARQRRARTAKKIKEILGEDFDNDTAWTITRQQTDAGQILSDLDTATPETNPEQIKNAIARIQPPLQGCGTWADPHRKPLAEQLSQALERVRDQALEADHFEIAKAALAAMKNL